MRNSTFYIQIIILFLTFSCKKDNEIIISKPYILAGDYKESGIVHIDLNPDSVLTTLFTSYDIKNINFDIDKDGKSDYKIILVYWISPGAEYSYSHVQPLGNNMIYAQDSFNTTRIIPMNFGDTINQNLKWVNKVSEISDFFNTSGGQSNLRTLWKVNEINFVGIMMPKEKDTLYGWIRIKFENDQPDYFFKDKITVMDYAYTLN